MLKLEVPLGPPAQDDADSDPDQVLARHLFGEEVREPLIINAELGIFPMDDDE